MVACGPLAFAANSYYWSGQAGLTSPNPVDLGYHIHSVLIEEISALRGKMPGLWGMPYVRPFTHWDTLENVDGLSGRTLRAVNAGGHDEGMTNSHAQVLIDVTGPWR
jgi:hypothetical protein